MKKFYTIIAAVFITASMFAQVPQKMSYQAVVRNSSDQLVTNQGIGMQVSILQSSATGTAVYVETQNTNTNANGLVSIEIGAGTLVSGDFSTIDWANGPYFIKTETDPTTAGGTNYTIIGTSQLLSVAYALHTNETQNLSQVLAQSNDAGTQIKNLTDPTDAQDAVTKAYVDLLEERIQILEGKMKDIDGNLYETVTIGDQVWMAENLKVTHYPNGDAIPYVTDNTVWSNLADNNTDDAYSYYNNNAYGEADTYGGLYTYAAAIGDNWENDLVDNQGVCPDGWHLPNSADFDALGTYLGTDAGSKLAGNAAYWTNGPLEQSADFGTSGFSALPGGGRFHLDGSFYNLYDFGGWWSATENSDNNAFFRFVNYSYTTFNISDTNKSGGFSVRCIKD